jgi:pyruvate/2-oxoacid:ferredoxin oxidoreductase alpha subunit
MHLDLDVQEEHEKHLHEKYQRFKEEVVSETFLTDDADIVLVSYGIASRISKRAVSLGRGEGLRLGLLRPITLNPFPYDLVRLLSDQGKRLLVVELNAGQMVQDVRLAANGSGEVEHLGRMGGNVPSAKEILSKAREMMN